MDVALSSDGSSHSETTSQSVTAGATKIDRRSRCYQQSFITAGVQWQTIFKIAFVDDVTSLCSICFEALYNDWFLKVRILPVRIDLKSSASGKFNEEDNNVLLEISRTGDVRHNWIVLRNMFAAKIVSVISHYNNMLIFG